MFGIVFLVFKHKSDVKERVEASNDLMLHSKKNELSIDRSIEKLYFILAVWLIKKNASKVTNKKDFVIHFMHEKFEIDKVLADSLFAEAFSYKFHIRSISGWVIDLLKTKESRVELFDFLFELVFADSDIIDREFTALIRLGELTGVPKEYIEKKIFQFRVESAKDFGNSHLFSMQDDKRKALSLTVLGLPFNATLKDVKSAYRKLMKEFHPDKNVHIDPEVVTQNQYKILEIQDAYEELIGLFNKNS